jgi:hypothetical protein
LILLNIRFQRAKVALISILSFRVRSDARAAWRHE